MTFRVHFYAEQAFLAQTKAMLADRDKKLEHQKSALCILACAAAIEAYCNSLLGKVIMFRHFDELRISSKIEHIQLHGGKEPSWGTEPWQTVGQLLRVRNWLAHYKDHSVGLVNGDLQWLADSSNKPPKIDPYKELTFDRAQRYYDLTRQTLILLASDAGVGIEEADFLRSEEYQIFELG